MRGKRLSASLPPPLQHKELPAAEMPMPSSPLARLVEFPCDLEALVFLINTEAWSGGFGKALS